MTKTKDAALSAGKLGTRCAQTVRSVAGFLHQPKRCQSAPDLLVLDDFGLKPLQPPAPEDLYDVINEQY